MKRIIDILAVAALVVSCHSGFEKAVTPTLEVRTDREAYFTDDAVVFHIDSDADFISFYSGEDGNDYEYAQKERIYEGELSLSFSTNFGSGNQWNRQADENPERKIIRFFWSSDFSGEYTNEAIAAATWNELTSLAKFPDFRATNVKSVAESVASGDIDVTELGQEGKPVYFAFKYLVDAYDGTNARSRVAVFNFLISSKATAVNAVSEALTHATAGWQFVTTGFETCVSNVPEVASSYLYFNCDTGIGNDLICWAVSAPVLLENKVNIGCDYGVGIKSYVDERLKTYTHTYSDPGTYDVCFVAANVDHEGVRKEIIKKLQVVVNEHCGDSIVQPDNNGKWE